MPVKNLDCYQQVKRKMNGRAKAAVNIADKEIPC
jgi:hypothetical protein